MVPVVGDKQPGEHLGAFVAVIPTAAANPDNAGKFISWMMGAQYQKAQTIETGDLPVRQDVLKDPDVQKALPGARGVPEGAALSDLPVHDMARIRFRAASARPFGRSSRNR